LGENCSAEALYPNRILLVSSRDVPAISEPCLIPPRHPRESGDLSPSQGFPPSRE